MATTIPQTKLTVLISGSGTNLQALIDACVPSAPLSHCRIVKVISDRKAAYGLIRAQNAGIAHKWLNYIPYKTAHPDPNANPAKPLEAFIEAKKAYDADLAREVLSDKPDLVVCAGYMRVLFPEFLGPLAKASVPVINLHPALPGEFDGTDAIGRAHRAGQAGEITRTGAMIHYVIQEVDRGEPIVTQEVPIVRGESEEALATRIHEVEHQLIVEGTRRATESLWASRR